MDESHAISKLPAAQDTLEVFVESPEATAPSKKLRKGLSKVFGRKESDSDNETESVDATSGVGEAEEALDGHLFSVGVAFAQVGQSLLQPALDLLLAYSLPAFYLYICPPCKPSVHLHTVWKPLTSAGCLHA